MYSRILARQRFHWSPSSGNGVAEGDRNGDRITEASGTLLAEMIIAWWRWIRSEVIVRRSGNDTNPEPMFAVVWLVVSSYRQAGEL